MKAKITRKPGQTHWVAYRAGFLGWLDKWGPFAGPSGTGQTPKRAYDDLVNEIASARSASEKAEVVYHPPKDAP